MILLFFHLQEVAAAKTEEAPAAVEEAAPAKVEETPAAVTEEAPKAEETPVATEAPKSEEAVKSEEAAKKEKLSRRLSARVGNLFQKAKKDFAPTEAATKEEEVAPLSEKVEEPAIKAPEPATAITA